MSFTFSHREKELELFAHTICTILVVCLPHITIVSEHLADKINGSICRAINLKSLKCVSVHLMLVSVSLNIRIETADDKSYQPHVCQSHIFIQFYISLYATPSDALPSSKFATFIQFHMKKAQLTQLSRAHKIIIQQTVLSREKIERKFTSHRSHFLNYRAQLPIPIVTHAKCDQITFQCMLFVAFGLLLINPCNMHTIYRSF